MPIEGKGNSRKKGEGKAMKETNQSLKSHQPEKGAKGNIKIKRDVWESHQNGIRIVNVFVTALVKLREKNQKNFVDREDQCQG